ncbi:hypothetical protein F5Y18DRAFT_434538 [Xylariaceae sp. FL1019]|nr:hypothetical protein F5Y18DRAFT_434538 [Xylariaceae sp. FL1019]
MCHDVRKTTYMCHHTSLRMIRASQFCLFEGQTGRQYHANIISKDTSEFLCPRCIAQCKGEDAPPKFVTQGVGWLDEAKRAELNQCARRNIERHLRHLAESSSFASLARDEAREKANAKARIELCKAIASVSSYLDRDSMFRTFATYYGTSHSDVEEKEILRLAKENGVKLVFWPALG